MVNDMITYQTASIKFVFSRSLPPTALPPPPLLIWCPFRAAWNASAVVEDDPILITFGNEVGVHVESMGKFSYQKAFRLRNDLKTFPIHTAVISVDEGEVGNEEGTLGVFGRVEVPGGDRLRGPTAEIARYWGR